MTQLIFQLISKERTKTYATNAQIITPKRPGANHIVQNFETCIKVATFIVLSNLQCCTGLNKFGECAAKAIQF